jgi:hypothetical protein
LLAALEAAFGMAEVVALVVLERELVLLSLAHTQLL